MMFMSTKFSSLQVPELDSERGRMKSLWISSDLHVCSVWKFSTRNPSAIIKLSLPFAPFVEISHPLHDFAQVQLNVLWNIDLSFCVLIHFVDAKRPNFSHKNEYPNPRGAHPTDSFSGNIPTISVERARVETASRRSNVAQKQFINSPISGKYTNDVRDIYRSDDALLWCCGVVACDCGFEHMPMYVRRCTSMRFMTSQVQVEPIKRRTKAKILFIIPSSPNIVDGVHLQETKWRLPQIKLISISPHSCGRGARCESKTSRETQDVNEHRKRKLKNHLHSVIEIRNLIQCDFYGLWASTLFQLHIGRVGEREKRNFSEHKWSQWLTWVTILLQQSGREKK